MRLMSKKMWLYTEMVTAMALLHGDAPSLLHYGQHEQPLALQVGGSDVAALKHAAKLAEDFGFKEVNLNVGCPSDRVKSGNFGACLMQDPPLVADLIAAMMSVVHIDVTVKTRVGVDDFHSYEYFLNFIDTVAATGCNVFIIHARKAWLSGLSPKENRTIPPLQYPWVYNLKQDRPKLEIIINGGVQTINDCTLHLGAVDGVMVGRAAYHDPFAFATVDSDIYAVDANPFTDPGSVLENYIPYVARELANGERFHHLIRPILPLFHGCKNAKVWRRFLTENSFTKGVGIDVLLNAQKLL
jgi:tRNA-dihydrouridine synthase A